jgi:ABC-2 type transport system permease protein
MVQVFRKAVHDSRKTMLWLSVGLMLYSLFVMSFFPSFQEQGEEIDELVQTYPEWMMNSFVGGNLEEFSITDPSYFVQTYVTTWGMLIIAATMIVQAFNAITNPERDGSMDVMLSLPIARRAMLLGRVANTALTALVVLTATLVVVIGGALIMEDFDAGIGDLMLGIYALFFLVMTIAGFAYMVAVLVPSSRGFAGAIVYLFVFGSYLVHGFAGAVEELEPVKHVLIYEYHNSGEIIRNGLDVGNLLVLLALSAIFYGVAWWRVERKEIGV